MKTTANCDYRNHKNVLIRELATGDIFEAISANGNNGLVLARSSENVLTNFSPDEVEIVRGLPSISGAVGTERGTEYMYFPMFKQLREMYGFTQIEFAKLMEIPQATYSQYELGYYGIPFDRLLRIANFYGIAPKDILNVHTDVPPVKIMSSEAAVASAAKHNDKLPVKPADDEREEEPWHQSDTQVYISRGKVNDFIPMLCPNTKMVLFDLVSSKKVFAGKVSDFSSDYAIYNNFLISLIDVCQDFFTDEMFVRIDVFK